MQTKEEQKKYIESLKIVGGLSNLFSDSTTPYLYYRIAEKIFCQSFLAKDLSRGDISLDASKANLGIGLKTFLKNNNKSLQKVAEFNKSRELYKEKDEYDTIYNISKLRNERIKFAENLSQVEQSIYHCVVRTSNKFYLFEESMNYIDIANITDVKKKKNTIWFNDGVSEYNFNLSKSTLLKRFYTNNFIDEFEIKILENPLEEIAKCLESKQILQDTSHKIIDTIYLPLYGKNHIVSPKSGLNQWNASGRQRDYNEVYIPIPAKVHKYSKSFFPNRDVQFTLHLPNGSHLNTKVCQDNSKALMSNPNKELGEWILRDVLNLKEGELLTYNKLEKIGIDSVRIDKIDNQNYKINFVVLDSYEEYLNYYENII